MAVELARNQFLTVVADVIQRGGARDAAGVEAVAKQAAADVAREHPGVDADALYASLPDPWRKDPTSSSARSTTNAFLQVAEVVHGVQPARVSPLAARLMQVGADAGTKKAMERAAAVDPSTSAALSAPVDLFDSVGVYAAMDAVWADPAFATMHALPRQRQAPRDLVGEFLGALAMSRKDADQMPAVYAGGVEVAGPDVLKAYRERPYGFFTDVPLAPTAGELASALLQIATVRDAIGERGLRGALNGGRAPYLSGRAAPAAAMPIHVGLNGEKLGVGLGSDAAALKKFQPADDVPDYDYAIRAGKALRALHDDLQKHKDAGVPIGVWADEKARGGAVVQAALAAATK